MHLTWFDTLIIVVLLASIVLGLLRGFLREVISLVSMVLSVLLAIKFSVLLSGYIPWWESDVVRYITAFACIFLVVILCGMLMGRVLKVAAKSLGLGVFDHILGAAFGAARGVVVVCVAMMLVGATAFSTSPWYKQSVIVTSSQGVVQWLDSYLPDDLQKVANMRWNSIIATSDAKDRIHKQVRSFH